MEKVAKDVAQAEVTAWLDKKKVLPSVRESYEDSVDTLIDAVAEGVLVLDQESFVFTHYLFFPIGENESIKELKYKPRINDKMLRPYLNGVKTGDGDGRLMAYIAALTGQAREVLASIDTADKKISMAVAIFFL